MTDPTATPQKPQKRPACGRRYSPAQRAQGESCLTLSRVARASVRGSSDRGQASGGYLARSQASLWRVSGTIAASSTRPSVAARPLISRLSSPAIPSRSIHCPVGDTCRRRRSSGGSPKSSPTSMPSLPEGSCSTASLLSVSRRSGSSILTTAPLVRRDHRRQQCTWLRRRSASS